jgi:hypothetical protein
MTDHNDRRKHARKDVDWPIQIFAGHGTIKGKARNISPEGLFVCCDEPLALDEDFSISVSPPEHDAIGLKGRVIWSDFYGLNEQNIPVCMGISFIEISEADRNLLKDIIAIYS